MDANQNTNDRELLELAAKAAGIDTRVLSEDNDGTCGYWNPRDDDGDALRLLASLPSLWSLSKKYGAPSIELDIAWGTGKGIHASERVTEGRCAAEAIRLAIFRAAVAVGRKMP